MIDCVDKGAKQQNMTRSIISKMHHWQDVVIVKMYDCQAVAKKYWQYGFHYAVAQSSITDMIVFA